MHVASVAAISDGRIRAAVPFDYTQGKLRPPLHLSGAHSAQFLALISTVGHRLKIVLW
jgi:hypothetical protein